jgi:cell division protein FtsB
MENLFYRKKKSPWDLREPFRRLLRNKRLLLLIAIATPLVGYLLFGSRGIIQRVRLEHQKVEMEQRLREAEAEADRLKQESKALDNDRAAIERVAREKHGMVRPGETVYRTSPTR